MQILAPCSWEAFRRRLANYLASDIQRRRQFIFRGQSDAAWELQTTLDRYRRFTSDDERERGFAELLRQFRRESLYAESYDRAEIRGDALELMARHHGLPTPFLDWTESPFIAAFFAFSTSANLPTTTNAAIWMLDRAKLEESDAVTIIDDERLLAMNRRAINQRSVFLRVRSIQQSVTQILGHALVKFQLEARTAATALAELDEMTINATRMFGDFDSAARTVGWRESIGDARHASR